MKEKRKEKIIQESHRECELETRLLRQQKMDLSGRGAALASTLRYAGRAAGALLPEGLARASAVPPARGAPTSGRTARPLHPTPTRWATRVRVCARPGAISH